MHHCTTALLFHKWRNCTRRVETALKVDLNRQVPLIFGHFVKNTIAKNTGIVNQAIHPAPSLNGDIDQIHGLGHQANIIRRRNSFTARLADALGNQLGNRDAVVIFSQVVNHHFGTLQCTVFGNALPHSAACTGNNNDLILQ